MRIGVALAARFWRGRLAGDPRSRAQDGLDSEVMRALPAVLLLALAPCMASAHDTWLLPDRARVARGEGLGFGLTSGMGFPAWESGVSPDRLVTRNLRLAGRTEPLGTKAGDKFLALSGAAATEGVATAWIATRPRTLSLDPHQADEYLAEIGATDSIGPLWKKSGQKTWVETYVKQAKTYVRVGEAADGSWGEPVGLGLEFVPEADPTRLRVGDALTLRLLVDGKPLADFSVGAVPAAPAAARMLRTDALGRVTVTLDQAGPWMLRATRIVPQGDQWSAIFTTLTVDVQAR